MRSHILYVTIRLSPVLLFSLPIAISACSATNLLLAEHAHHSRGEHCSHTPLSLSLLFIYFFFYLVSTLPCSSLLPPSVSTSVFPLSLSPSIPSLVVSVLTCLLMRQLIQYQMEMVLIGKGMIDWRPLSEREPDFEEIWVETEKDV